MIQAVRVYPQDLTDQDITWLILGCEGSYDGAKAIDQVLAAKERRAGIHRLVGDVEGVFVLADRELDGRKGFEITALAGKGLLRNFAQVHEIICSVARGAGAEFVMGYVTKGPLAEIYRRRTKAKEVASVFVEELK